MTQWKNSIFLCHISVFYAKVEQERGKTVLDMHKKEQILSLRTNTISKSKKNSKYKSNCNQQKGNV